MTENFLYDNKNPLSIEAYAKKLIGLTFLEVLSLNDSNNERLSDSVDAYGDKKRKGGLGNLLEEVYFGYKANSESEADFKEAGVELKATPYEINKNGDYRAGERLVLTMINYSGEIEPELEKSHMWEKSKLLLLIYYWRNHAVDSNLYYRIDFVSLFTPTQTDLEIIKSDYNYIAKKVIEGKAEELSEADTMYLGACTKGATAESSIVDQYYPPHTPAKKRAFCYKTSYMTFVLNEYIRAGIQTYEPVIKDIAELEGNTFENFIIKKISRFVGKTDKELCALFDRDYDNNKAQWTELTYRMLDIKSNQAAEFRKANITVKVVRIEENGKMKESISLPPFRYRELVEENWEESTLHDYFDETKFFFVIFKRCGNSYVLSGCKFWNMPNSDLNGDVKTGWQAIVDKINDGIHFNFKETEHGIVVENDLPKKNDNRIIHVRPHAQKRYFEFANGTVIGDGNRSHANQLPDGTWMPNYSFWLNNDYIIDQLGIE